jgi:cytoskeleton protein RodZ
MNAGLELRQAREQRRLSLRDVSNVTKVPIGALEAIELNAIDRLPGGIFTRGFIRSYAAAVGLDPHAAVDDFLAQFDREPSTESIDLPAEPADTEAPANRIPMFGSLALGAFLLLYGAYVASIGTSAESSPPTLLPASPIVVSPLRLPAAPAPTAVALVPVQSRTVRAFVRSGPATSTATLPEASSTPANLQGTDSRTAIAEPQPQAEVPAAEAPSLDPVPNEPDPGSD